MVGDKRLFMRVILQCYIEKGLEYKLRQRRFIKNRVIFCDLVEVLELYWQSIEDGVKDLEIRIYRNGY